MSRLSDLRRLFLLSVYAFLFAPGLIVMVFSFNTSRFFTLPLKGVTLQWYSEMLSKPPLIEATRNSFLVAGPTAVLAVVLGTLSALVIARQPRDALLRRLVDNVLPMPLIIPGIIWGIALLIFFTQFSVPLSVYAVMIGHTLLTLPYVILTVSTRLFTMDPEIEEAALSLGARPFEVFYRIVLPHIAPALLSSGLMAFTISFNEFVVAFFLTGGGFNTLPIYIYSLIRWETSPVINAVSTVILILAVIPVFVVGRLQGAAALGAPEASELNQRQEGAIQ